MSLSTVTHRFTVNPLIWKHLVGLTVAFGSPASVFVAWKLVKYTRSVLSANAYETGDVYDHEYEEDFNEEEHTHFSPTDKAGSIETSSERDLRILREFICNKIIPNFKHHRVSSDRHFAILLLLDDSLSTLSENWEFKPQTKHSNPQVDSEYCTRPSRDIYGNHVVACPQLHRVCPLLRRLLQLFFKVPSYFYEHAEEMLLTEFDILKEKFEAEGRFETNIILFSWLFPCNLCTNKIIKKFGREFRAKNPAVQQVIIVFVSFWRRMPFEENWNSFEKLKANGFDIVRVKYNSAEL